MSSAYHPQTDGQTERTNQCLEMYLRCAILDTPKQWASWLPLAEFWYSSTHHSAIGCSPFNALFGVEPSVGQVPDIQSIAHPDVLDLMTERDAFRVHLQTQLAKAQTRMKLLADRNRSPREFQVGDMVFVKLQPYAQLSMVSRSFPKLAYKFYGPYKVLARIGSATYKLALATTSLIHPVFHVSQLKGFVPDHTQYIPLCQFLLLWMQILCCRNVSWSVALSSVGMLLTFN